MTASKLCHSWANRMKIFYLEVGYVTRQMSYPTTFKNKSKSHDLLNMLGGTTALQTHSTYTVTQFNGTTALQTHSTHAVTQFNGTTALQTHSTLL
jgi:hypothetical protein